VKVKVKKSPGRKRRITGWTLLLLGLLVAGGWVASRWWAFMFICPTESYHIDRGQFTRMGLDPTASPAPVSRVTGFAVLRLPPSERNWRLWSGWFSYGFMGHYGYGVVERTVDPRTTNVFTLMLWPIPLLLWTPATLLLRSGILARRRAMTGNCAKCGYSLAGLGADSLCPECGKGAGTTWT
jgi:hypothetical protein